MKRFITMGLLACAFASTAFEAESGAEPYQKVRIGVTMDYTLAAMEQVNGQLNKGVDVTKVGPGFTGMLEFDKFIVPFLFVGARAGYLFCLPGSVSYNYVLYKQTTTVNTSLIPLEAGVSVNFDLPATPISINAGIYGGYGFAFAQYKNDISPLAGQSSTFTRPFNGGSIIGELPVAVNLKLFSALSINLNGGFRYAKILKMVQSQDVNYEGIAGIDFPAGKKGDILKDSDNNDLAIDFSGFNIGVGLSLSF
jgi:hypothetical protein